MTFGETLRKRRKELGLTLEEVSKSIGVGRSCVLKYEKENVKNIGADKIIPLANILQCGVMDLLKPLTKRKG